MESVLGWARRLVPAGCLNITLGVLASGLTWGGEMRVFRSAEGVPLRASFEGMSADKVVLRRDDGKTFELPKEKLSAADQTYVTEALAKQADAAKKINDAAGHPLTDGSSFAKCKAEDLAKALQLRPESRTKYGSSWRLYAAYVKDYKLFGAMPYSVALYSDAAGCVTSLSIVYANKGDFGSKAGFGEDHFKGGTEATADTLAAAMERDEKAVSTVLTEALGKGKPQHYGEGETRRKITRWDWRDYAFLLSNEENEYVGLSVVSTEFANNGGKSVKMKDNELKQRLLDSIVKSANGDVYLSEIPMVDQGPKGYCVPATFERTMRTMGLDADMYLLAMVGQSKAGGGTSVELLLNNVRSLVYRKGRRTRDEPIKELRIRDIKRFLDQGIPVMWTMVSIDSYNKIANENTAKRAQVNDWKAYAQEIAAAAKTVTSDPKPSNSERRHICMIIGYNEATQEVAVSDSWGSHFERRWVPLAVADWVSTGNLFMILP